MFYWGWPAPGKYRSSAERTDWSQLLHLGIQGGKYISVFLEEYDLEGKTYYVCVTFMLPGSCRCSPEPSVGVLLITVR